MKEKAANARAARSEAGVPHVSAAHAAEEAAPIATVAQ
jgi:hypothetical protein